MRHHATHLHPHWHSIIPWDSFCQMTAIKPVPITQSGSRKLHSAVRHGFGLDAVPLWIASGLCLVFAREQDSLVDIVVEILQVHTPSVKQPNHLKGQDLHNVCSLQVATKKCMNRFPHHPNVLPLGLSRINRPEVVSHLRARSVSYRFW